MLVGHYAPAFAAKRIAPRVPLGLLLLCAQLVDVGWNVLVLLGVERLRLVPGQPSNPLDLYYMPYTHSLPATVVWSGAAFLVTRSRFGTHGAALVAATVASHWLCDLVVHRPDLPLLWSGPKVGLGLWDWPVAECLLEIALVAGAAWWCTAGSPGVSARAVARLAGALVAVQLAMALGPEPTSIVPLVSAAFVFYLAVAAAGVWVERRRPA